MRLLRDPSGQGMLEYGLILGLCAMIAIGALLVFGTGSATSLARVGNSMGDAGAASVRSGSE